MVELYEIDPSIVYVDRAIRDALIAIRALDPKRETALVITKLEEARFWLHAVGAQTMIDAAVAKVALNAAEAKK